MEPRIGEYRLQILIPWSMPRQIRTTEGSCQVSGCPTVSPWETFSMLTLCVLESRDERFSLVLPRPMHRIPLQLCSLLMTLERHWRAWFLRRALHAKRCLARMLWCIGLLHGCCVPDDAWSSVVLASWTGSACLTCLKHACCGVTGAA